MIFFFSTLTVWFIFLVGLNDISITHYKLGLPHENFEYTAFIFSTVHSTPIINWNIWLNWYTLFQTMTNMFAWYQAKNVHVCVTRAIMWKGKLCKLHFHWNLNFKATTLFSHTFLTCFKYMFTEGLVNKISYYRILMQINCHK